MTAIAPIAAPPKVLSKHQTGLLLALASFAMLFGSMMLAAMLLRMRQTVWPPMGVNPMPASWPTFSIMCLALSGLLQYHALQAAEAGAVSRQKLFFSVAGLLGALTLASHLGLWLHLHSSGGLAANLYHSIVFALSCLHGMYVLAGLIGFLAVSRRLKTEAPVLLSWYWYFLGAVWLPIFAYIVM